MTNSFRNCVIFSRAFGKLPGNLINTIMNVAEHQYYAIGETHPVFNRVAEMSEFVLILNGPKVTNLSNEAASYSSIQSKPLQSDYLYLRSMLRCYLMG
ncbi:MAG: hypothetical protein HY314_00330 [Acidobacteria bacterium]|nr:hypothetical protein [Acidobacteriota bacterium]